MSGQPENAKPTHHFGRGGAGNVTAKTSQSPPMEPTTTPTLKSKMYTTGRGGTGNMARNDNPEEARIAQDIDVPGITLPENSHHTGRGGAANTYTPTEAEKVDAQEHNEKVRRDSFKKSSGERSGIEGLAHKAKEAIRGNKNDTGVV